MSFAKDAVTRVTASVLVCGLFYASSPAMAGPQQEASTGSATVSAEVSADQPIEEVVITGSLIPHVREVTAVPTSTISADDLLNKGYVSVADALQQQVYSTGSVQGAQFSGGFTPGVQTLSLFGLSPSYVKYLIDGRPMADYPALYNGTDVVTNISGVPEDLVDHIDILPGGQSSLYGSDAIAGVVNVIMKKNIDTPILTARIGGYKDGGGTDRRFTVAAGHGFGVVNVMGGDRVREGRPDLGLPARSDQGVLQRGHRAGGRRARLAGLQPVY